MGKFAKLNDDIQILARKVIDNQELSKLLYYPDTYPLEQPDLSTRKRRELLYDRLLLFTPKIPLADEVGSYVMIRVPKGRPIGGGYYIASLLLFDIYTHVDSRYIRFKDVNGKDKAGDRALMIADEIEGFMDNMRLSIGENGLHGFNDIANTDSSFSGYQLGYEDIDFRKQYE